MLRCDLGIVIFGGLLAKIAQEGLSFSSENIIEVPRGCGLPSVRIGTLVLWPLAQVEVGTFAVVMRFLLLNNIYTQAVCLRGLSSTPGS